MTVPTCAPLIVARHAATLPTLPGWSVPVYEGPANTEYDDGGWCTLAYVSGSDGAQVSFTQTPPRDDGTVAEDGTIVCELVVAGNDVPAARAAIFALLDVWRSWLHADRSQGGALLPISSLALGAEVTVGLTQGGGVASAAVTITYTAYTYR